jgi:GAF domain-containing protein
MAVSTPPLRSLTPNRRRRLRHRTQSPAYLSFDGGSQSALLELHEIVNICEDGVAIQCHSPLEPGRSMSLCLDLAGGAEQIYTTGQVVWSTPAGRAGLRFTELPPAPLFILREWLFQNAMAGAEETGPGVPPGPHVPATPGYTDTLAAVIAVQREVEALGPDLAGALRLIATRTQILLRASGAALALSASDPDVMECRASSGPDAPPVGAKLQVGSGFSGECVKTGRLLRCDDTELDSRVDRESCRALGIRAILAAPVRVGTKSIGLVEVFSQKPSAFTESDNRVVQRLAETVLAAVNRAARAEKSVPGRTPAC